MKCVICGSKNYDGGFDQYGNFVCVDCIADGSAECEGRNVEVNVEADTSFSYNRK